MPTPEIFDFGGEEMEAHEVARTAAALERHPAIYVNHLRIARHIDAAASELAQRDSSGDSEADRRYHEGYVAALRTLVDSLRRADYTPSGPLLNPDKHTSGRFKAR